MRVKILREDARTANYEDTDDCPLARALKRAGHQDIFVGGTGCRIGDRWFRFPCHVEPDAWNQFTMRMLAVSEKSFRWLTLTEVK